ncbi:UNVERIFIED_CONTAM: putative mitochondrial protein [Sesamum latifolium]|uniref:Mitochondrial protein n=1 Tax=Sesamum latifolium TaxID=2727402 RepID=A0AAW2XIZ9_9LAMI
MGDRTQEFHCNWSIAVTNCSFRMQYKKKLLLFIKNWKALRRSRRQFGDNARFRTDLIRKIKRDDGVWIESVDGIRDYVVSYFRKVFTCNHPSATDISLGTAQLRLVVDPGMAGELLSPYTEMEVTKALFQMTSFKSPGPNDMPPIFFQSFWQLFNMKTSLGDPISPYLFLLCTEAFSSLLQYTEQEGSIPRVSICRGTPSISHLLLEDDTLIFSGASPAISWAILDVLEIYNRASGQEINFAKSSIAFSRNSLEGV